MTSQAMPNPIELLEAAIQQTRKAVVGTRPSQLNDLTPCADWNVQALLDHMLGPMSLVSSSLTGTLIPPFIAGKNRVADYDNATSTLLKAAKTPGAMEKPVRTFFAEINGAQAVSIIFLDQLVHGWDLAKATGQDTRLDPKLAEACWAMFGNQFDNFRKLGGFGPAIPVPASADIQTRLLATSGRKP